MKEKMHVINNLPAYALGCLEPEEEQRVNGHLKECDPCINDFTSYENIVDLLYCTARTAEPPLSLKKRVMRGIKLQMRKAHKERALHPGGWFGAVKMSPVWGALALVLIVVLLAGNILLWRQVKQLRTIVMKEEVHFVSVSGTDAAPLAHGYIYISDDGAQGTLIAEELPPLDVEHQYQVWLIDNGKRASGGVFGVTREGYGSLQIFAPRPLGSYTSFGVSVEPVGGSIAPTGMKVMGVTPAE